MDLVTFNNINYPQFQTIGNASQFSIPFAKYFCKGYGYDIGFSKEEWKFPNARGIDLSLDDGYHANNLPDGEVDYVYSSHCLEHLPDWVTALDYWTANLKPGGVLFLYLPHYNQEYWRPFNNRKHLHMFSAESIRDYMIDRGYTNIFHSDRDMNDSFMIVGEKDDFQY